MILYYKMKSIEKYQTVKNKYFENSDSESEFEDENFLKKFYEKKDSSDSDITHYKKILDNFYKEDDEFSLDNFNIEFNNNFFYYEECFTDSMILHKKQYNIKNPEKN